jgi:hypothetical protein
LNAKNEIKDKQLTTTASVAGTPKTKSIIFVVYETRQNIKSTCEVTTCIIYRKQCISLSKLLQFQTIHMLSNSEEYA